MRSAFAYLRRTNPDVLFRDAKGRYYWKSQGTRYNVYMTRRSVDPKKHESEVIHNDDLVNNSFPFFSSLLIGAYT